ncbi:MAG: FixH family protein [Dehalococcoidia bacterium]
MPKLVTFVAFNVVTILTAVFIIQWSSSEQLEAHGNMKYIHHSVAGEYDLKVSLIPHQPITGSVHFHVEPTLVSNQEPVETAIITVVIRQGEEAFQSRAVNSPASPKIYDANLTFETPGEWEVEVKISTKPDAEDKTKFQLNVLDAGSATSNAAGIFFLFVFLVLIIGSTTLYFRYGRKAKTR